MTLWAYENCFCLKMYGAGMLYLPQFFGDYVIATQFAKGTLVLRQWHKLWKTSLKLGSECRNMQVKLFGEWDAFNCALRIVFSHLLVLGSGGTEVWGTSWHNLNIFCAYQYFKPCWITFVMCFLCILCSAVCNRSRMLRVIHPLNDSG